MKKKIETALWIVLALAALVALVIGVKALNSKYLMTARYLETGDGRPMIVYSGGCVLLQGKDGSFDGYADGDKIFVMTEQGGSEPHPGGADRCRPGAGAVYRLNNRKIYGI